MSLKRNKSSNSLINVPEPIEKMKAMKIHSTNHSKNRKQLVRYYLLIVFSYLLIVFSVSAAESQTFTITGSTEIIHCDFSSPDGTVWALAMDFDPSVKDQKSTYSILKFSRNKSISQYKLPILMGTIVTPYRAKNQVRFFRLIDNRYLYIGTMQLDGTIYFVKFDTRHPENKQESMKMRLKGDTDAANIFVTDDGSLRFVGSENDLPYFVALDTNKQTIFEKKGFGLSGTGKLKLSALLNNGYLLLAFNTYQGDETGTASLALLNTKGEVVEKKKLQGLVVEIKPAGDTSAIILIAHDQGGKDMEAQAVDNHLNVISRYPVPEYFKLIDAAGQLLGVNSTTLLSILVNRTHGSQSFADLETYSTSGSKSIGQINNSLPGELRAYNISSQLIGRTLYIGTAVIGISNENKGQKTFQIETFTVQ